MPLTRRAFPDIAPAAWEHPSDAAALRAMRALPGFDRLVGATLGRFNEKVMGLRLVEGSQPVNAESAPRLHKLYEAVLTCLDAPDPIPLYLKSMGAINAITAGVDAPFIVLSTEAETNLDDAQLKVILGHELGHILSGHVRYKMMMGMLFSLGWTSALLPATLPLMGAVTLAMLEWDRKSELSADRACALVVGGAGPVVATLQAASGPRPFLWGKAEAFPQSWRQPLGKLVGEAEKLVQRHPTVEARAAALQAWVDSPEWTAIQEGDYKKRQDQPRPGTLDDIRAGADALKAGLAEAMSGMGWKR